jgi:3-mercaptopyruvate sulfurtransferase SseA
VRPLQGGLDAWGAAGYAVQRLPLATEVSSKNVARAPARTVAAEARKSFTQKRLLTGLQAT